MMFNGVALLLVTVLLLLALVEGKGSFGYTRSSSGGYYRTTKRGYYSSRTRYYTGGMYWRTGYSTRNYQNSRNIDTSSAGTTSADLKDVLCKREIRLNDNSVAQASFNATMHCVKELYALPGDPGNLPYEKLMLNRIKWDFLLDPYPTAQMTVYPDKAIENVVAQMGVRLTRIFFADSLGGEVLSFGLNSSTVTWKPCTLEGCDGSLSTLQPSSRFLDGGRVVSVAAEATLPTGMIVNIRFWLSGDFNEDTERDHVFLMPSLTKIDIDVTAGNMTELCSLANCNNGLFAGVEAYLVVPKSGAGSKMSIIPATLTSTYAPRNMSRVEIGTNTDQKDGKASLFSWWASSQRPALCQRTNPSVGQCLQLLDNTTSSPVNTKVCGLESPDPRCAQLYQNASGQTTIPLRFLFGGSGLSSSRWFTYFQLGYWDPNEGVIPNEPSGAFQISTVFVFVAAIVAAAM